MGDRRLLMIAESGLAQMGGMELRGMELCASFQQSYSVTVLSKPKWHRFWLRGMSTKQLCRRVARIRPDIVYLHKFGSMPRPVLEAVGALSVPVIARFGDRYATNLSEVWRPANHDMTLVFNCRFTRDFYLPLFPLAPHHTIYTGVDTTRFRPPAGDAGFVFLGRTVAEKGFLDFCEAMARLPASTVAAIDIVGQGAHLKDGLRILRAARREKLLRWVGPCAHDAIAERLRSSAILVMPAHRESADTLSTAVLEGMACGLAVIATNVAGTSEAVRHNETGLLVPPRDLNGLVGACQALATDPGRRARLGQAARRFVERRHERSAWLQSMMEVIDSAYARNAPVNRNVG